MRYIELKEVKEAYLYHTTDFISLSSIISEDELKARTRHTLKINGSSKDVWGVSLTRSYHFAKEWGDGGGYPGSKAILILNQNKIKFNKKILPVDFFATAYINGIENLVKEDEHEEFVIGSINPLHKYLIKILLKGSISNAKENYKKLLTNMTYEKRYEPVLTQLEKLLDDYSKKYNIPVEYL